MGKLLLSAAKGPIGVAIRTAQITREISNQDLAAKIDIAPNAIAMIVRGSMPVPYARIKPLAEALGLNLRDFFVLIMREQRPDDLAAIESVVGRILTNVEQKAAV